MNIYFAGPLFTLAERRFNEELSAEMQRLCPTLEIFFPQCCDKQFQGLPDFAQRVFQSFDGSPGSLRCGCGDSRRRRFRLGYLH